MTINIELSVKHTYINSKTTRDVSEQNSVKISHTVTGYQGIRHYAVKVRKVFKITKRTTNF